MPLAQLSTVLWREREMLEVLLFKVETEQMVLATGRTRWLSRASHEVELILEQVRDTELLRAIEADQVCCEFGLAAGSSLADVADAVEEPWRSILIQHRDELMLLVSHIATMTDKNRDLLAAGDRATYTALLAIGAGADPLTRAGAAAGTYTPGGRAGTGRRRTMDGVG